MVTYLFLTETIYLGDFRCRHAPFILGWMQSHAMMLPMPQILKLFRIGA